MGPLGHFAIGILCGTLIMLPFLRDRSLFDYNKQKWISVEWVSYLHTEKTSSETKLITTDDRRETSITDELNPITKSKFVLFTPFVALLCGIFALLPDISHLWGNSMMDHSRYADLFFFHRTLDVIYVNNQFFINYGYLAEMLVVFTSLLLFIGMIAVSQDFQYNRHNYENLTV